jgi:5-methylcytosine-specific restriction endonuclease McrA
MRKAACTFNRKSWMRRYGAKYRASHCKYFRDYNRAYYKGNAKRLREYARRYRKQNVEAIRAADKKRRERDREIRRIRERERYRREGDRIRKREKRRYQRERERIKARVARYRRDNLDKVRASRSASFHAVRAMRKKAKGFFTSADIKIILIKQDGRCAARDCRKPIKDQYHIDHITPLKRGGSNWPKNLQLLCRACNLSKGTKTMREWQLWKKETSKWQKCSSMDNKI